MPVCFLMKERKDVDLGGEGSRKNLRGIGERETVIKIYGKKSISSFLKKKITFCTIKPLCEINSSIYWSKKASAITLECMAILYLLYLKICIRFYLLMEQDTRDTTTHVEVTGQCKQRSLCPSLSHKHFQIITQKLVLIINAQPMAQAHY